MDDSWRISLHEEHVNSTILPRCELVSKRCPKFSETHSSVRPCVFYNALLGVIWLKKKRLLVGSSSIPYWLNAKQISTNIFILCLFWAGNCWLKHLCNTPFRYAFVYPNWSRLTLWLVRKVISIRKRHMSPIVKITVIFVSILISWLNIRRDIKIFPFTTN